jgi:CBS domain-containing protein
VVVAKELMNTDVYAIYSDRNIFELLKLFDEKKVSGVPVVDKDNLLVGIITIGDVLSRIHKPLPFFDAMIYIAVLDTDAIIMGEIYDVLEKPVSELMTRKVITVTEDTGFADVAKLLSRYKFKKLPVVAGKKLIGVVSRGEVVRYFIREYLQKINKETTG